MSLPAVPCSPPARPWPCPLPSSMAVPPPPNLFREPRDPKKVRDAVKAAGHGGEKVVVLVPTNSTTQKPLGEYKQPTLYRKPVTGVLDGTAVFWNVRPA